MRSQIKEMDEELQRTMKNGDDLKLTMNEKKLHSDTLTTAVKRLKAQLAEKEKLIRLFVEDLHKIYTETDPSEHRNGLLTLYVPGGV
jgi:regulator of replication initiation timing